MFNSKAALSSQEELVEKVLQIRADSKERSLFMTNLVLWFAAERITKKQKHLIFTGLYHRHDKYGDLFDMAEMLAMWHQCEMLDYVDPLVLPEQPISTYLKAVQHLEPVTPDWCNRSYQEA